MLATIRDVRGQGDAALYVRARDAAARFWDFQAGSWVPAETADCRVFLTEVQDADLNESRYSAEINTPPVDLVIEYVIFSDFSVLGEDSVPVAAPGVLNLASLVLRALALAGANRVSDQEVLDAGNRVTSARIRIYDTAANAQSAGVTGLLATYTVAASYSPEGSCTMTVTEVLT